MSTKNLKRTPLEAGHYDGKNQRRNGKNHDPRRSTRAAQRAAISKYNPEDEDLHVDEPGTKTRNADNLGAIKGWILKQCGRPWDKVYSDMAETFDFNTMAGRHILGHVKGYIEFGYDHELYSSWNNKKLEFPSRWALAYVDKHGMLRRNRYYRKPGPLTKEQLAVREKRHQEYQKKKEIDAWLKAHKGMQLGRQGAVLFWYEITTQDVKVWCEDPRCHRKHEFSDKERECPQYEGAAKAYRYHLTQATKAERRTKLNKEEMAFYNSLPEDLRPTCAVVDGYLHHKDRHGLTR